MKLTTLYNPVCKMRRVKTKFLLVMKLTAILLLACFLHVSAATFSQSVTLSKRTTTLKNVFREIKKQTGYYFFYKGQLLQDRPELTLELKNASLSQTMNRVLEGTNLSYNIVGKTIVISAVDQPAGKPVPAEQRADFKGKVTDKETGEAIPGVNISIKNGASVGVTNDKGEFRISVDEGTIIVFSYVGYQIQEAKATGTKALNIRLSSTQLQMNDVVITGYQTIKKDNYTGNAITIKGADLKANNPQNLIKSIESFDPSFRILDNNLFGADPNALPQINVRGNTALPSISDADNLLDRNNLSSTYNLPAFILDGFEVTLQKVTDLDINRIESVTLLKDAAATAVYGSRAANGVVVITTRAPVAGKLQLSYNYELTLKAPDLSDYHVLNAKDKLSYERLAGLYTNNNSTANTQEQLDADYFNRLKNVASGVDTYWLSQALRNAYRQKHSMFIQGGDQKFRYGVDLRYETQPGVMLKSDRDRYSGGMSFTYNPNPNLIFKNELSITQVNGNNSPYGSFSNYVLMNPYFPRTNQYGDYIQELANWRVDTALPGADRVKNLLGQDQVRSAYTFNPLFEGTLNSFDKNSTTEILDAFSIDWKISPSLNFKSQISLNQSKLSSDVFVSPLSSAFYTYPTDKLNNRGSYSFNESDRLAIDGKATLGYNKNIGDQFFNLVAGVNVTSTRNDFKSVEAQGFSNDRFSNVGFARIYKENSAPGGDVTESRLAGMFFSGNYAFKNKYLLDGSFRYEGSSAFGSNKRFAPFWSAGIGWNMHREDFLAKSSLISQLRLKASTGTVGSVSFPPYLSRSIYQYNSSNWYSTGIGATVLGYGNSDLQWQKTKTYDAGFDLGLFKDRFVISPGFYYKLTEGLITDIDLAPSTGFTTYKENLGDMSNKGFEVYLKANVWSGKSLNVNITGNMAHNVNRLVSISNSLKNLNDKVDQYQTNPEKNARATPLLRYNEGQSTSTFYAVKSLGIDPENGKEIFVKKDGSLTYIWDVKDIQPLVDTAPKASGNVAANVSYKGLYLNLNFYYRFGGYAYNQTLVDRVENADPRYNVDSRVLSDRWVKPGDQAFFKNIADLTLTNVSSRFLQKDNLIELRSVNLSYDLAKRLVKQIGFQTIRTSLTANDLFRTSSIEMERGITYPFERSFTLSLQASF